MKILIIVMFATLIVFTVQLIRVAVYLKRVGGIPHSVSRVLCVILRAPLHEDLSHPNTLSKIRVSCVFYLGVATGYQMKISKKTYPDNKG